MQPPEPHFSFTIPSIHDDTPLQIRIYHPRVLSTPQSSFDLRDINAWRRKGILMAHPYAPMGGSYDDRIVGIVTEEFLKAGWVVGTFNFRGAGGAKGRTSWSGKPELSDYQTVAGFFMHYMSYLRPSPSLEDVLSPDQSPISPIDRSLDEAPVATPDKSPIIVLGGYSYGSVMLRNLPPVPSILQPFSAPLSGSSAEECLLRAHKLADQTNQEHISQVQDLERMKHRGHSHKLSITMGGEETSPAKRRSSKEIRRSMDLPRKMDIGKPFRRLSQKRHGHEKSQNMDQSSTIRPVIQVPEVRYLLVSPVTPPTSTVVAPGLVHSFWNRSATTENGDIFAKHLTLAVSGDQDMFASAKKTREWVDRIQGVSQSKLDYVAIHGAGHFWHEHGVERQFREALTEWEKKIRE